MFDNKSLSAHEEEMNRFYILMFFCCSAMAASVSSSANAAEHDNLQSAQVVYGVSLYEEYCADCHQSFAKTTKPKRSIKRLSSSIELFLDGGRTVMTEQVFPTVPYSRVELVQTGDFETRGVVVESIQSAWAENADMH